MKNIFEFFKKDNIGEPPYDYYFLKNLDEKEYPLYLAKLFYLNTGEKLPLKYDFKNKSWIIDKKRCKTFNQKIQWIKLYGVTDLMRKCTDKVAVRDYAAEKIGEAYLKPVLQVIPSFNCDCHVIARNNSTLGDESIQRKRSQKAVHENWEMKSNNQPDCHVAIAPRNDGQLNNVLTYFDQINFDKLPNSFVIKCNHGCKWHFIIKNKKEYIENNQLVDMTKEQINGWLKQEYWCWSGFEMQYKGIKPKILIEPLLRENLNTDIVKINVYCFENAPKIYIKFFDKHKMSIWDEMLNPIDNIFNFTEENIKTEIENNVFNKLTDLSIKLSKEFSFVRIDWMLFQNKLYFEEMTFTPYSGLNKLSKKTDFMLGNFLNKF